MNIFTVTVFLGGGREKRDGQIARPEAQMLISTKQGPLMRRLN